MLKLRTACWLGCGYAALSCMMERLEAFAHFPMLGATWALAGLVIGILLLVDLIGELTTAAAGLKQLNGLLPTVRVAGLKMVWLLMLRKSFGRLAAHCRKCADTTSSPRVELFYLRVEHWCLCHQMRSGASLEAMMEETIP